MPVFYHCDPPLEHHRNSTQSTGNEGCTLHLGREWAGWAPIPWSGQSSWDIESLRLQGHLVYLPSQGRNPRSRLSFPGAKQGRTRTHARVHKEQDALSGGILYLNAIHLFGVWEKPPVDSFAGKRSLCGRGSGRRGHGFAKSWLPPEVCLLSRVAAASVGEQDGHLRAHGGCFRLGPLWVGWLFGLPRGVVFGGRRAAVLKSHGFDLLKDRRAKGHGWGVRAILFTPGLGSHCSFTLFPSGSASFMCSSSKCLCLPWGSTGDHHSVRCYVQIQEWTELPWQMTGRTSASVGKNKMLREWVGVSSWSWNGACQGRPSGGRVISIKNWRMMGLSSRNRRGAITDLRTGSWVRGYDPFEKI